MSAESPVGPTLWIQSVKRLPSFGPEDQLELSPGLNVFVGVPNTGKSKWLRMIDFLLGDDNKPGDAFGNDIAEKYNSCQAVLVVAGAEWTLERRWKEEGLATKVAVNSEWMTLHAFSLKLMGALGIPVLHYPQGNPHGPRTWPELGWRSLFRHAYRRQPWWSDLADRQPESEQHACILQFVGQAEVIFSDHYAQLVSLEKKILHLQNMREQFVAMLQEVSRELIQERELDVALTPESIASAIHRHSSEIDTLQSQRDATLASLIEKSVATGEPKVEGVDRKGLLEQVGRQLARAREAEEESATALRRTRTRVDDLKSHRELIAQELERVRRALDAGTLLSDLKITHCPACDRAVDVKLAETEPDNCYICRRPHVQSGSGGATRRLEFELEQLGGELKETNQLIAILAAETDELASANENAASEIVRLELRLRPVRRAAAFVLPPELTLLDQETGRLQERVAQLRRIRSTLDKREAISSDIVRIQEEVSKLEVLLSEQSKRVSSSVASDWLTDGMNTYLNVINELKPNSWTQAPIDFVLRPRGFMVRVGRSDWQSKLGGTLTLFFLMAYHYALLRLVSKQGCHYPGLCILDFPAQLDGVTVTDSENFVLEPFRRLMQQAPATTQLIAAGSSFDGLKQANRIEFSKVWRERL